jgi:NitT/TauT family transport system ATP-binding protein
VTVTAVAPARAADAEVAPVKVSIEGLSVAFRGEDKTVRVLEGIDLQVRRGDFVCILGPSGCG